MAITRRNIRRLGPLRRSASRRNAPIESENMCSQSLDEILNMFVAVGKDGIDRPLYESEVVGHAEGICSMLNLFSMDELARLKKDNEQIFTVFQVAFLYLGQTSPTFVGVCRRKLEPAVNKLMNNSSKMAIKNAKQMGGAGGDDVPWFLKAKYVGYLVLVIWLLMSADAVMYPSSVGVVAVLKAYMMSLTGMDRVQGLMKGLLGNKEQEYPVAYAEGLGVKQMGVGIHAASKAALALQAAAEENQENLANLLRDASMAHVHATTEMKAAAACAESGTCESPAVTAIGLAVTPLVKAEEARPILTQEELTLNEKLAIVAAELERENAKFSIWDRNDGVIEELSENYAKIEAEIAALAKLKGILPEFPKLSNPVNVARSLGGVSTNLLRQLTPSSGVLPARVMQLANNGPKSPFVFEGEAMSQSAFSLVKNNLGEDLQAEIVAENIVPKAVAYRAPKVVSEAAMLKAGINHLQVSIEALAKKHPGQLVTLSDLQRLAGASNILTAAQMSVGTKTTYDPRAVLALVDAALPQGVAEGPDYSRNLMVYMATEAAANQAHQNARIKAGVISEQMAKVVDASLKDEMVTILETLVTQLVELGFSGERDDAVRLVKKAIDTSRIFGVLPNIKTTYYASSVLQCNTGKCEMKPYSELRSQAELKRELESLPYKERFMRVKYNILLSLIPLIGVGGVVIIIQALFRSAISVADIGVLLKRMVFGSDVARNAANALAKLKGEHALEIERKKHEQEILALAPAAAEPAAAPAAAEPAAAPAAAEPAAAPAAAEPAAAPAAAPPPLAQTPGRFRIGLTPAARARIADLRAAEAAAPPGRGRASSTAGPGGGTRRRTRNKRRSRRRSSRRR
jgi:hypothetical protein